MLTVSSPDRVVERSARTVLASRIHAGPMIDVNRFVASLVLRPSRGGRVARARKGSGNETSL